MKKILTAAAMGLLLTACQQQPPAASQAPATPVRQLFVVYFNTGQSDISAEGQAKVDQAAATFKQGGVNVTVKGHADRVGNQGANLRLSMARTANVKAALMRAGVPESAIRSGSLGEENLPIPTADQVPEQLNRSVHIAVIGRPLMSDKDYCAALARKWRSYSRTDASGPAPQAIAQCDSGNYDAGITVLEQILTDDRVVLPSRYL
ncbi:MAG: OmpA family protein [Reyranellaceae bacterium]